MINVREKLKIFCVLIIFVLFGFLLGACSSNVNTQQTYPLKIWKQNENGKMETFCVVDEDTGVNYVVVTGELHSHAVGTAITPRLNADGTLYIKK